MSNNRINNDNHPHSFGPDGNGHGNRGNEIGNDNQPGNHRDENIGGDHYQKSTTGRGNGPVSVNLRIGNRDGDDGNNRNQIDRDNNGHHWGDRHHDHDFGRDNNGGHRNGRGNMRVAEVVNLGDFWRNTLNNGNRNNPNVNPVTNNGQDNNVNYQNQNNPNTNPLGNNQNPNVNPTISNHQQTTVQSQIPTYQANNQYARNFYNPPQNFSPTNYAPQTTNNNPAVTAPTFNQSSNPVSFNNINNPTIVTLPRNDHNDAGFRTVQPDLISSATNFLRGVTDGLDLSPELRQVLSVTSSVLGTDFVNRLDPAINAQQPVNLLTRALETINNQLSNPGLHLGNLNHLPRDPNAVIKVAIEDTISSYQLTRYMDQMGRSGGNVVQQAEEVLTNFLFGIKDAPANLLQNNSADNILRNLISDKLFKGFTPEQITQYLSFSKIFRDINPAEVLRDLRNGSFVSPYETFNPFPLTGRARVASEMIEMMHLLDKVEQFAQYLALQKGSLGQSVPLNAETLRMLEKFLAGMDMPEEFLMMLKTALANGKMFTFEEFMQLFQVALPGRAARSIIPEVILALNGMLPNLDAKFLTAKDGTPLMLDKLVWLNLAGGLVTNITSMFDSFPTRLSPLLLYGFDAIYTLIGFDGRTLAHRHFAAVQANINDAEVEWLYGQEPFSMGWMREMIERLKDSHVTGHNLLGEQLEEAMAHGCFHTLLINISVEQGSPVKEDIRVTPQTTPDFAGDFAFASSAVAG